MEVSVETPGMLPVVVMSSRGPPGAQELARACVWSRKGRARPLLSVATGTQYSDKIHLPLMLEFGSEESDRG